MCSNQNPKCSYRNPKCSNQNPKCSYQNPKCSYSHFLIITKVRVRKLINLLIKLPNCIRKSSTTISQSRFYRRRDRKKRNTNKRKNKTSLPISNTTKQNKTKQLKHSNSNTTINWLQIIKQTRVPLFHNATTFYHRTTRTDSYYKIKIKKIKKKYLGYSMFGFILFFLYV